MNAFQSQKIDLILQLFFEDDRLVIDESSHQLIESKKIYVDEVIERFGFDKCEVEDLFRIISQIKFQDVSIVNVNEHNGEITAIKPKYITKQFVDVGGCKAYYKNLIDDQKSKNDLKALEVQKLRNDIASFKITKKQYYWSIGIAIAGFVLALGSLILQIFLKLS